MGQGTRKVYHLEREFCSNFVVRALVFLLNGGTKGLHDRNDNTGDEDQQNDVLGRASAIFILMKGFEEGEECVGL